MVSRQLHLDQCRCHPSQCILCICCTSRWLLTNLLPEVGLRIRRTPHSYQYTDSSQQMEKARERTPGHGSCGQQQQQPHALACSAHAGLGRRAIQAHIPQAGVQQRAHVHLQRRAGCGRGFPDWRTCLDLIWQCSAAVFGSTAVYCSLSQTHISGPLELPATSRVRKGSRGLACYCNRACATSSRK